LFKNKLFGKLITILNSHPVNRRGFDRKAINTALEILNSGEGLLMFPEGTRSKTDDFLPARPGLGMVAKKSGVPIIPAYINASNKPLKCLLGKERAGIVYGSMMTPDEFESYSDDRDGYQQLSDEVLNRIRKLKEDFLNKFNKKLN
jgi:1-acyl-sn-glycerol-3-phosphate acyltransferase